LLEASSFLFWVSVLFLLISTVLQFYCSQTLFAILFDYRRQNVILDDAH
jgi:hypothetical protein